MQSDEVKQNVEQLMRDVKDFEKKYPMTAQMELEVIKTKAILMNVIAVNELNWAFYYSKEELKNLRELKRMHPV